MWLCGHLCALCVLYAVPLVSRSKKLHSVHSLYVLTEPISAQFPPQKRENTAQGRRNLEPALKPKTYIP